MESFQEWRDRLVESNARILVEGKNDALKLKKLGVSGERILEVSCKPVYRVVDEVQDDELIVVLTDLDAQGKKLYRALKEHLQRHGKKIDKRFRNFLFQKTRISHIEGIPLVD